MKKQKTKILYLITKSSWGGAQKYVYDLAVSLPEDSFDIAVVSGGEGLLTKKLRSAGIRVISIPFLKRDIALGNDLRSFISLARIIYTERPDILHVNSAKAGGIGAFLGRILGVQKIFFTAHGWAFNEKRSFLSRFFIHFFSFLTVLLSHRTIAVSRSIQNDVAHFPFIRKKIALISNGISPFPLLGRAEAQELLLKERLSGTPENALWIGTIAELHSNKGLSYALSACNLLKEKGIPFVYVVVGDGEKKFELQNIVENSGLEKEVFIVGFRENAPSLLRAFDIFLLPSLTEALGYVILEAGIAELPVIGTRIGGIPEIIRDGETGFLVPTKDPNAIAEKIEFISKNRDRANILGKALRNKVITDHDLSSIVNKTKELYKI